MPNRVITVQCYAGNKADQRPRTISIDGRTHHVSRLLSESIEESRDSREQVRRFKVVTIEDVLLEVVHSSDDNWYLVERDLTS